MIHRLVRDDAGSFDARRVDRDVIPSAPSDDPRGSRGGPAFATPWLPRGSAAGSSRARVATPRNIHVAPGSPRNIHEAPRGGAATRLEKISPRGDGTRPRGRSRVARRRRVRRQREVVDAVRQAARRRRRGEVQVSGERQRRGRDLSPGLEETRNIHVAYRGGAAMRPAKTVGLRHPRFLSFIKGRRSSSARLRPWNIHVAPRGGAAIRSEDLAIHVEGAMF